MSPNGSKIDFVGDLIFESAAWFFVIIMKFISTLIFEIKIHEKKFLDSKKIKVVDAGVRISIRVSILKIAIYWDRGRIFNIPGMGLIFGNEIRTGMRFWKILRSDLLFIF